jgi:hypothetical protein
VLHTIVYSSLENNSEGASYNISSWALFAVRGALGNLGDPGSWPADNFGGIWDSRLGSYQFCGDGSPLLVIGDRRGLGPPLAA